jgi:GntR family galactonate operon transcriptional repressor
MGYRLSLPGQARDLIDIFMAFSNLSADEDFRPDHNPAVERLISPHSGTRADSKVLHQLGREIVLGEYPADERMPDEATMLARYDITRTALREAYGQLSAKGMIVAKPKVGTTVTPPIYWNMLDPEVLLWHLDSKPLDEIAMSLHPLRRMIEPGAAALAAQMRSDSELARIETAYLQMKGAGRDRDELIAADLRFHLEILSATRNPFIGAFNTLLSTVMQRTLVLGWNGVDSASLKPARLLQHQDVLEAIRLRNPDVARMRMEILVDDSLKDVMDGLAMASAAPRSATG